MRLLDRLGSIKLKLGVVIVAAVAVSSVVSTAGFRLGVPQVERLGRLVTQLLDLSRLESGSVPLQRRPFLVREMLEEAAGECRLHAPDVTVEVDVVPDDLTLDADPERVHQVVANLLESSWPSLPPASSAPGGWGTGGPGRFCCSPRRSGCGSASAALGFVVDPLRRNRGNRDEGDESEPGSPRAAPAVVRGVLLGAPVIVILGLGSVEAVTVLGGLVAVFAASRARRPHHEASSSGSASA